MDMKTRECLIMMMTHHESVKECEDFIVVTTRKNQGKRGGIGQRVDGYQKM